MENNFIMKPNEILLWISVIILVIMSYLLNMKYSIVLMFWVIIIIFVGNAKRFYSKEYFISSTIIRRSMYIIPFILPLITDFKLNINSNNLLNWCLLGFITGIVLILPKINEWGIALSKDIIEFTIKKHKIDYYTQIFVLIGASISEEIFFRNFVIGYVDNISYAFSIPLSCILFFLNHFGVKWNSEFTMYDYIIQIIFAIASSILFISSKSILPSIIAHTIYNFPPMLLAIKSYTYHYIYKGAKSDNKIV